MTGSSEKKNATSVVINKRGCIASQGPVKVTPLRCFTLHTLVKCSTSYLIIGN